MIEAPASLHRRFLLACTRISPPGSSPSRAISRTDRFALAAAMGHLLDLAELAERSGLPSDGRLHAGTLRRAIDDFAASIAERFHGRVAGSTREALEAYAHDHAVRPRRA